VGTLKKSRGIRPAGGGRMAPRKASASGGEGQRGGVSRRGKGQGKLGWGIDSLIAPGKAYPKGGGEAHAKQGREAAAGNQIRRPRGEREGRLNFSGKERGDLAFLMRLDERRGCHVKRKEKEEKEVGPRKEGKRRLLILPLMITNIKTGRLRCARGRGRKKGKGTEEDRGRTPEQERFLSIRLREKRLVREAAF